MDHADLTRLFVRALPPLTCQGFKGSSGRIGVIGGTFEYTGPPFFAAISALKVGADVVHIFCSSATAPVIKSYSPDLIVHPFLDDKDCLNQIKPWLERLHVLVIGPGMGRAPDIMANVTDVINCCRELKIPLVIDSDGLYLVSQDINLIINYPLPGVILTPNKPEFERLGDSLRANTSLHDDYDTFSIDKLGNNAVILCKGLKDRLYAKNKLFTWTIKTGGSGRRCVGQGDLLSGAAATFFFWMVNYYREGESEADAMLPASLACYGAAKLARGCNQKAFALKGRSMICSDMIEQIHNAICDCFECKE